MGRGLKALGVAVAGTYSGRQQHVFPSSILHSHMLHPGSPRYLHRPAPTPSARTLVRHGQSIHA